MAAPPLDFDDAQKAVLAHPSGALLVTGGPGTGKTAVLRERFARLIEGGAEPERVVLVLGSRGARDAAKAALLERLPASLPGLQVLTFHGLGYRVLKLPRGRAARGAGGRRAVRAGARAARRAGPRGVARVRAAARRARVRRRGPPVPHARCRSRCCRPRISSRRPAPRGLSGWAELARFAQEYLDALDSVNQVDFAGLVQLAAVVAGNGESLFDHVLVDDYQDTTLAAEALLGSARRRERRRRRPTPTRTSSRSRARPTCRWIGSRPTVPRRRAHRAGRRVPKPRPARPCRRGWRRIPPRSTRRSRASCAASTSRTASPWGELAVVVRRQGTHLGNLLRALDDARDPARGAGARAVAHVGVRHLPLRAGVALARGRRRRARGADRAAADLRRGRALAGGGARADAVGQGTGPAPRAAAAALDRTDGLTPTKRHGSNARAPRWTRRRCSRACRCRTRSRSCGRSCRAPARLVERGPGASSTPSVTFANVVAEAVGAGRRGRAGVPRGARRRRARARAGPRARSRCADAVQVLTAHGAIGLEFDTVLVAGATEGNFPSRCRAPSRCSTSLCSHGPHLASERNRDRLEDERRLFRMVLGPGAAPRRPRSRATPTRRRRRLAQRSRFVDELPGVRWTRAPEAGRSTSRCRVARGRRGRGGATLADPDAPTAWRASPRSKGSSRSASTPRRWWFQRDWTDTGARCTRRCALSYSRLSNARELRAAARAVDELGLGRPGRLPRVGGQDSCTASSRTCEHGELRARPRGRSLAEVDERWRAAGVPVASPCREAYRQLATTTHAQELVRPVRRRRRRSRTSSTSSSSSTDATIVGVHRPDRPDRAGRHAASPTTRPAARDDAPKAEESLQLGIYYLAVQESDELAEYRPVRPSSSRTCKGDWKAGDASSCRRLAGRRSATRRQYQGGVRDAARRG